LSPDEQALAARITEVAGKGAIFGASERLHRQRGLREKFKRGVEISGRYDKLFRDIFRQAGLPEDLAYLPHVESSFQNHARSSAGASGMWQFTRPAAQTYMTTHPALDERLDPVMAAHGAARYLSHAYNALGDWALALTSYNHGIGGMKKAQAQFGNDFTGIVQHYDGPGFGFASRNFYAEFLAAREVAGHPQRYFPEGVHPEPELDWDRVVLRQDALPSELALYYSVNNYQLLTMNPAWTKSARANQIALPEGTTVWLPTGTLKRIAQLSTGPRALASANTARDRDAATCTGEDC
jgi:membrane-bound lytic murein transglycosylase D